MVGAAVKILLAPRDRGERLSYSCTVDSKLERREDVGILKLFRGPGDLGQLYKPGCRGRHEGNQVALPIASV